MLNGEFRDPRLVAVYDAAFPWTEQDDFFVSVVAEEPATRVLDLGCGTGRLALGLTAAGYAVTGVEPARASLDAARAKPGADAVTWVEGTAADLPDAAYDVAVMTSHVAQLIARDDYWASTLAALHRALVPGGRLVFDSRDPSARGWERWTPVATRRDVRLPDGRLVTMWDESLTVAEDTVTGTQRYRFSSGEDLSSTVTLRFRSEGRLRSMLATAGFRVDAVYGGWHREPVGHPDGELLVLGRTV